MMMRCFAEVDIGYSCSKLNELYEFQMSEFQWPFSHLVCDCHLAEVELCVDCSIVEVDRADKVFVALASWLGFCSLATDVVVVEKLKYLVN